MLAVMVLDKLPAGEVTPAGVTADFLDETARYRRRSFGLRRALTAVRAVSPLTTA